MVALTFTLVVGACLRESSRVAQMVVAGKTGLALLTFEEGAIRR